MRHGPRGGALSANVGETAIPRKITVGVYGHLLMKYQREPELTVRDVAARLVEGMRENPQRPIVDRERVLPREREPAATA